MTYINFLEKLQPIFPISIYEHPLSNNQMKFFTYSIYPFLLKSFFLPTQPPFNQSHLLLEKQTQAYGCRYYVFFFFFFKIENLHQQIIKSISWNCVMEPSKLELFTKKLTAYSRKQFPQKVST